MDTGLTESQISILLSANEEGWIKIPNGTAMEIDENRRILGRLQKKGLVKQKEDAPYYSGFRLTEAGITVKCELVLLKTEIGRKTAL